MNSYPPGSERPRNLITAAHHRREVFWQITVPLTVGVVIMLVLVGLSAFATSAGSKSQLADAALVGLVSQALLFGLVTLLLLGGTVYGLFRLLGVLPYFFMRTQIFFLRVQLGVMKVDERLVEPILRMHSFNARSRAFGRGVRRAFWFR
jgi:hypothetical protein